MNRFSMWFSNFMRGRYGMDHLSRFLLIVALVSMVADWFLRWRILDLITIVLLIYVYCRTFSRNINARYRENQRFLAFSSRLKSKSARSGGYGSSGSYGTGGSHRNASHFTSGFGSGKDKDHKILRCPACGNQLRVPKGAGKIKIKCPHCQANFYKKV